MRDKELTDREKQIVSGLQRGLQNKEIASELVLTEQTVKFHITNINKKLGTKTRIQIVAMMAGLWPPPPPEGRLPTGV
jgi:LuxR family transcriptional regulator, positive regulator of biofilm formation